MVFYTSDQWKSGSACPRDMTTDIYREVLTFVAVVRARGYIQMT